MPLPTGLWLWQDAKSIRWWSVYAQGRVDVNQEPDISGSLANVLQDKAEEAFIRSLKELRYYPSAIHLLDSLTDAWINFAWENRRLSNGQRIGDYAPVLRHVSSSAPRPVIINQNSNLLVLRFYSDANFKPKKWSGKSVQRTLNEEDLRNKINDDPEAPLLIFAHGNNGEDRFSKPLKDADNNPWQWPTNITPPSVVIILACDHAGHQRQFARWMLQHGAQSVVIATDLLNAKTAWTMAEDFSSARIKKHFSLAQWVFTQQNLELWGVDAICSADSWVDRLYARAKNSTLFKKSLAAMQKHPLFRQQIQKTMASQIRYNRISSSEPSDDLDQHESMATWLSLQALFMPAQDLNGNTVRSVHLWHHAYGMDKEDEFDALAWLTAMQGLFPRWHKQEWNEITHWVLPLALELSERHKHELMAFFSGFCTEDESIEIHAALAKICYRKGDYCRSLNHITYTIDNEGKSIVSLLTLLNILIDLNLPTLGTDLFNTIKLRSHNMSEDDLHSHQFKLLDQHARLSMRSGDIRHAIRLMKQKQKEQLLNNRPTHRENAWLLFLYAWKDPQSIDAQNLAKLAQEYLKCDNIQLGDGNADHKYMAKALSCWAWRADNMDAAAVIKNFWQRDCHEDYGIDPGPLGQGIAYIALLENTHTQQGWASEEWPHARAAMQDECYWLETSILDLILEKTKESQLAYKRFKQLRNNAISILSKTEFLSLWSIEEINAIQHDTDVAFSLFNHNSHVSSPDISEQIKELTKHGMLPL